MMISARERDRTPEWARRATTTTMMSMEGATGANEVTTMIIPERERQETVDRAMTTHDVYHGIDKGGEGGDDDDSGKGKGGDSKKGDSDGQGSGKEWTRTAQERQQGRRQ
jgi:hypothetical protein